MLTNFQGPVTNKISVDVTEKVPSNTSCLLHCYRNAAFLSDGIFLGKEPFNPFAPIGRICRSICPILQT